MITHPTNRARRRLTSLIEANARYRYARPPTFRQGRERFTDVLKKRIITNGLYINKSSVNNPLIYIVFQKSDAKLEITITTTNLIRIKYPLSSLNYRLSGAKVANFNKIHRTVFEQLLFKKSNSKTEVSNMEKSP